jgi:BASS family bile acid:Na+ symporter
MLAFVIASMLAVGLGLTVSEILAPLRRGKIVVFALLANFVLMPLVALAITKLLHLDQPLGIAFLLLGTAAGAPFLPKLSAIAKGNLAFSVGLMVLLMVLTVGYLPLVLPLLLKGVSVDPGKIARSLVILMLLPLGIGLVVRARYAGIAARGEPWLNRLSTLSLGIMIVLLVVTNVQNIIGLFGTRGVLASILFLGAGLGIGWLLGGAELSTKSVMALGTAQRNIAAALLVAGQSFNDPKIVVMVVVVAVVGLVIFLPFSRMAASRSAPAESVLKSG